MNGTYAEQSGLWNGLPCFRHDQRFGLELRCYGGYWRLGLTSKEGYRQRFDPSSPLPKQNGWELDSSAHPPHSWGPS